MVFSALWVQRAQAQGASASSTLTAQKAMVDRYCVGCHNDKAKVANFPLQNANFSAAGDHPELWEPVIRKLRAGLMPPPGMPRPAVADYEKLRDTLETEIDRKAAARVNPGTVVLHRLNRSEYANAVRDLLAVEVNAAEMLPVDDTAQGFDNIASALQVSPSFIEQYVIAARNVAVREFTLIAPELRLTGAGTVPVRVSFVSATVVWGVVVDGDVSDEQPDSSRLGTATRRNVANRMGSTSQRHGATGHQRGRLWHRALRGSPLSRTAL